MKKKTVVLGISCYYHDAAACILRDGVVIAAAAEERFTRIKHDNSFPEKAIDFCLQTAGVAINEVDAVAFYEKPIIKFERILHQHLHYFPQSYKIFKDTMGGWFNKKLDIKDTLKEKCHYFGKVFFFPHHLTHAASSYYLSGFSKAVIVTLDGVGEWATTTVGTGQRREIKLDSEIQFPHSLGLLYSTITTYLGFSANDAEYKVMGLAAYGKPDDFRRHFDELITVFDDGSYQLNMKYFEYEWSDHMPSPELIKLFGHPPRAAESKMKPHYQNIAAALQEKLEEVVFHLLTTAYQKYKIPNLCLSGGVALNSVMNGKLLARTPYKSVYIPPDPGDAGGAMGAAFLAHYQLSSKPIKHQDFNPYLGPGYNWAQIKTVLKTYPVKFQLVTDRKKLLERVAGLLARQKIIGWFQGRMEWGPRALGSRSILASAATEKMRDIINEKVKHRELFRPFAPVILEEKTHQYFKADKPVPISARYMLMVYPFKKKGYGDVPAVVHVDGSGRLQTLARQDNPLYYDLIKKYAAKTKVPIIINTSFNVRGEPIVCTPQDALNCFLHTDIDYLVMDQYIVSKVKS